MRFVDDDGDAVDFNESFIKDYPSMLVHAEETVDGEDHEAYARLNVEQAENLIRLLRDFVYHHKERKETPPAPPPSAQSVGDFVWGPLDKVALEKKLAKARLTLERTQSCFAASSDWRREIADVLEETK